MDGDAKEIADEAAGDAMVAAAAAVNMAAQTVQQHNFYEDERWTQLQQEHSNLRERLATVEERLDSHSHEPAALPDEPEAVPADSPPPQMEPAPLIAPPPKPAPRLTRR